MNVEGTNLTQQKQTNKRRGEQGPDRTNPSPHNTQQQAATTTEGATHTHTHTHTPSHTLSTPPGERGEGEGGGGHSAVAAPPPAARSPPPPPRPPLLPPSPEKRQVAQKKMGANRPASRPARRGSHPASTCCASSLCPPSFSSSETLKIPKQGGPKKVSRSQGPETASRGRTLQKPLFFGASEKLFCRPPERPLAFVPESWWPGELGEGGGERGMVKAMQWMQSAAFLHPTRVQMQDLGGHPPILPPSSCPLLLRRSRAIRTDRLRW